MTLWTIQSEQPWAVLQETGVLQADRRHITEFAWLPAYEWMMRCMVASVGPPPKPDCVPIWAWCQWEGKRKKPDLRCGGHLPKGEPGVRLELEIPDGTALLSDFSLWHYPLNYWYLPATGDDGDAFEEELASHGLSFYTQKPVPDAAYHEMIVRSWDRIFDLDWIEPDLSEPREKKSIQATIWEIRSDQVRSYRRFVSR